MIFASSAPHAIAVVIPCFRVRAHILHVLADIPDFVTAIYVVDDACPENTGQYARENCGDARLQVLVNEHNLGVGGATSRGYRQALDDGHDIVVKMDGDGQMDAAQLPRLLRPILAREADYSKGNRFAGYALHHNSLQAMPPLRRLGNGLLSFGHKAVSGYWNILDPCNGYTAIHRVALQGLDWDSLARDYFFETDMLFQLNLLGAVVRDVPMPPRYGEEKSNLRIARVLGRFPGLLLNRVLRRLAARYFWHDFNVASVEILCGAPLFFGGIIYGFYRWIAGIATNQINTAGTVMLGALSIILGFQLLLSALSYDITNLPKIPLLVLLDETDESEILPHACEAPAHEATRQRVVR